MNYRIEEKGNFKVKGVKTQVSFADNADNGIIVNFWKQLSKDTEDKLLGLSNGVFSGLIGVSEHSNDNQFNYYISVTSDNNDDDGLTILELPPCEWAVFECSGAVSETNTETWKRIFTDWFPQSAYESANFPCLEIFKKDDMRSAACDWEIWIPVKKK